MDYCSVLYKEEHEKHIHICVDEFLETPWVKEIMMQRRNGHPNCECYDEGIQLESSASLRTNIHLFLKWISNRILELDPERKKKVVLEIIDKQNLDYVAALTFELRNILKGNELSNIDIKNTLLSTEKFLPFQYWPRSWIIHIKWKPRNIPEKFWKLENIEFINYEKSWGEEPLQCLPYQIGKLTNLRFLRLIRNKLDTLPISLYFCEKLEHLDLRDNCFRSLPMFLKDMPNLQFIFRSQNPLEFDLSYGVHTECLETEGAPKIEKLVQLAAKSVCKQRLLEQYVADDLNIPRDLKSYIQYVSSSLKYCYGCKRGMGENDSVVKYSSTMDNFVGNCNMKVYCYSCSLCSEDVLAYMTKVSWTNMDDQCNKKGFLYSNDDVNLSDLHQRNCSDCNSGATRFFKIFKVCR